MAWHDVECASYAADLPLWRELARAAPRARARARLRDRPGGAGPGARAGHEVTALDSEPALVAELARRARARGLRVDARHARTPARFALGSASSRWSIAPMQVVQLLGGADGPRAPCSSACRAHLAPGGMVAVALADPFEGFGDRRRPSTAAGRARGGRAGCSRASRWRCASVPGAAWPIDRLRQVGLARRGARRGARHASASTTLRPRSSEHEAAAAGLRAVGRRQVPPTARPRRQHGRAARGGG